MDVYVKNQAVPRKARNGRVYGKGGGSSFVSSSTSTAESPFIITAEKVTCDRDFHVIGNISASEEVIAWVAGAVTSDVLSALSAVAPLYKPTGSSVGIKIKSTQFEVNANNELQIKTGTPNGIAELDSSGVVKSSQLPSFVDDVIDGQLINTTTFNALQTPYNPGGTVTPSGGKIYLDIYTNMTYRWSGTIFVATNSQIALGETSSTAYRGDRGKIAYDHSQTSHNYAPSSGSSNYIQASPATAQNAFINIAGDIQINQFKLKFDQNGVRSWHFGNVNNGNIELSSADHLGSLKILNTAESTSSTTGAVIVMGGVGVGGAIVANGVNSPKFSLGALSDVDVNGSVWNGLTSRGSSGLDINNYYGLNFNVGSGRALTFDIYRNATFATNINVGGNITASGEVTAYSDVRLKSNIQPLELRGELNPVTYEKDGKKSIGFIAQQVKEIYPELVLGDEETEMLSLNYQQLTAVLYAEIIELKKRLKKLE